MQTQFDSNRTFGVEIETSRSGPSIATIARALNNAGIDTVAVGYTHRTMATWKVVPDGSTGPEVVSPPLSGQAGLEEIARVCEVLQSIGCSVDRTTGIHVHHNFRGGTEDQLKSVLFLYAKAQVLTNALLPTRVDNTFSRQLHLANIRIGARRAVRHSTRIVGGRSTSEERMRFFASNVVSGRYYTVNPQSYLGHGTVEFRQHSGSLNASKIQAWVVFTQNIVTAAVTKKVSPKEFNNKRSAAWQVLAAIGRDTNCEETKKARQNIVQRIYANAERGRGGLTLTTLPEFLGVAVKYLTREQRRTLRQLNG
jgi:hypothetical protein